jgi:hypothetical protein
MLPRSELCREGSQIIEAKGTVGTADVELTDNARPKACNLRGRYSGFTSLTTGRADLQSPRRIQGPFGKLVMKAGVRVRIDETAIFDAA